eukprot:TRINITY_DN14807_c0_g1_i1.p1 TRINITY_DN14807_c0_g1~~TRINITY_DN14807_c0_g1_i1.p1  ORF type:complete len:234 (-),score=71.70 TRINITY_DN14807_c0_g1_i1:62-763(-)
MIRSKLFPWIIFALFVVLCQRLLSSYRPRSGAPAKHPQMMSGAAGKTMEEDYAAIARIPIFHHPPAVKHRPSVWAQDPPSWGTKWADKAPECTFRYPMSCPQPTSAAINESASLEFTNPLSSDYHNNPPSSKQRKVAICLSGGMRTFGDITDEIHRTFVKPNDADVFVYGGVEADSMGATRALLDSLPWVKAYQLETTPDERLETLLRKEFCVPDGGVHRNDPHRVPSMLRQG